MRGGTAVTTTTTTAPTETTIPGGVGQSPTRPDGTLKVKGEFAYSSDLWFDEALFGVTLRSPHPRARITGIDISAALAVPGVYAVFTHEDVPGSKYYGLDHADQPVLAIDEVRYQGEPVAILAASDPHTARRAVSRIEVSYDVLEPLIDARAAVFDSTVDRIHPAGNLVRHQPIRHGSPDTATADDRNHDARDEGSGARDRSGTVARWSLGGVRRRTSGKATVVRAARRWRPADSADRSRYRRIAATA